MISFEYWLVFALILMIIELNSLTFYLLSIAVGSLCASLMSYLGYSLLFQVIVFIIVSIVCIFLSRPLANKFKERGNNSKYNTERLIGKRAKVIEEIDVDKVGKIIIGEEIWLAVADEYIGVNEFVTVRSIDSTKLVVSKDY